GTLLFSFSRYRSVSRPAAFVTRPQADWIASADLHHVAGLSAERLWHQPESERARESCAKRLIGLLQLLDLMGNDLDELLKLLELRRDDGQQLLEQRELLLLKGLYLLKLLRHDLQQLRNLLSRRLTAESRADVGNGAPRILCHRIHD